MFYLIMFSVGYYLGSSGKRPTVITNPDGSISIAPEPLANGGTSQQTQIMAQQQSYTIGPSYDPSTSGDQQMTQPVLNGFRW